jgi:histidyl-tRNA synthetase
LLLSQAEAGPPPCQLDLYVVSRGEEAEALALPLVCSCRAVGLAVEWDASGAAFAKQFKRADRSGARFAAVLGDGDAAEGVVRLKPLRADQPEQRLALAQLPPLLLQLCRP